MILRRKRLENHDHKVVTHPRRNHLPPLVSHLHHFVSSFIENYFKFKLAKSGKKNEMEEDYIKLREKEMEMEEAYIKLMEKEMEMEEARSRRFEELKMKKIEFQHRQIELMAQTK